MRRSEIAPFQPADVRAGVCQQALRDDLAAREMPQDQPRVCSALAPLVPEVESVAKTARAMGNELRQARAILVVELLRDVGMKEERRTICGQFVSDGGQLLKRVAVPQIVRNVLGNGDGLPQEFATVVVLRPDQRLQPGDIAGGIDIEGLQVDADALVDARGQRDEWRDERAAQLGIHL